MLSHQIKKFVFRFVAQPPYWN